MLRKPHKILYHERNCPSTIMFSVVLKRLTARALVEVPALETALKVGIHTHSDVDIATTPGDIHSLQGLDDDCDRPIVRSARYQINYHKEGHILGRVPIDIPELRARGQPFDAVLAGALPAKVMKGRQQHPHAAAEIAQAPFVLRILRKFQQELQLRSG